MNPEALKELLARANEWRRAGKSVADLDTALRKRIGMGYRQLVTLAKSGALNENPEAMAAPMTTKDLFRSGGQGMTLKFLDELAGAGAAITPGGKGYTEARDNMRDADANFRAAHPTADIAANVVGSLPVALATGGASAPAQGAGIVGRTAASMGAGALFGGAAGLGDAETMSDAPMAMATGAAGGAAMGLGAAGLTEAAGAAGGMARRAIGTVLPKAAGELQAGADIRGAASSAGMSPEKFVLNPNTGIAADLRELTGVRGPADAAREAAAKRLSATGTTLFGPLDEAYPVMASTELKAVTDHPTVAPIWKNIIGARKKGSAGFPEYHTLWKRLGNEVKKLRKSGDTDLATEIGSVRDELTSAMEDVAPGFRGAVRGYANTSPTVEGFDLGAKAMKQKLGGRAVARRMVDLAKKAGPEAQAAIEAMRHGYVDEMARSIERSSRTTNVGQSIARMGKDRLDALRVMFPSPGSFEAFMQKAAEAGQLSVLQGAVMNAAKPAAGEAGANWRSVVRKAFAPPDAFNSSRALKLENALRGGNVPSRFPKALQLLDQFPDASAVGAAPAMAPMAPQLLDSLLRH